LLPVARAATYYDRPFRHLDRLVARQRLLRGSAGAARQPRRAFWRAALAVRSTTAPVSSSFSTCRPSPERQSGDAGAAARVLAETDRRTATVVGSEERALLSSPISARSAYLEAAMSGKKRKELRRQAKRLGELGELAGRAACRRRGARSLDRRFPGALEHAGWKGAEGSSLASHAPVAAYFRSALQGGAAAGRLERLALTLDGAPIAMLATFIAAPGSFSFKTAFDERYAKFSPGVLLQQENLALLDRGDIAWCDSCAAADHPMIERIWREKRATIAVNIALGGPLKRTAFRLLSRLERSAEPWGMNCDG
jgi:hypothetical protein